MDVMLVVFVLVCPERIAIDPVMDVIFELIVESDPVIVAIFVFIVLTMPLIAFCALVLVK